MNALALQLKSTSGGKSNASQLRIDITSQGIGL